MILCGSDTITLADLPNEFRENVYNILHIEGIPADAQLAGTLVMVEKRMIERALKLSQNVQSHAASMLGIGKSGLNQKLKKFGIRISSNS